MATPSSKAVPRDFLDRLAWNVHHVRYAPSFSCSPNCRYLRYFTTYHFRTSLESCQHVAESIWLIPSRDVFESLCILYAQFEPDFKLDAA